MPANVLHDIVFFPGIGIRTSTVAMGILLVVFGALRRQPLQGQLAALAWVFGFEIAWEITGYWMSGGRLPGAPGWLPVGAAAIIMAWEAKVQIEWRWLGVTAVLWAIWVATGFHYNMQTDRSIDWGSEIVNEAAKTAWGLAYLWPFIRPKRVSKADAIGEAQAAVPRVGGSAEAERSERKEQVGAARE